MFTSQPIRAEPGRKPWQVPGVERIGAKKAEDGYTRDNGDGVFSTS